MQNSETAELWINWLGRTVDTWRKPNQIFLKFKIEFSKISEKLTKSARSLRFICWASRRILNALRITNCIVKKIYKWEPKGIKSLKQTKNRIKRWNCENIRNTKLDNWMSTVQGWTKWSFARTREFVVHTVKKVSDCNKEDRILRPYNH